MMAEWNNTYRQARLEERLPEGVVRCHLSPRQCTIKEGKLGFCRVRGNRDGRLVTYNYGKGVHMTEEIIETEAVFHFSPGARILSLGNVGCMLNCGYCHNWKTSQARYVEDQDVHGYTPEEVVETAKRHGIQILSWTYNDPVVWHEFVLDTARLAQEAGMYNLFKSSFFISEEAVDELVPYIDIFSISIKAIDEEYYQRVTTGRLQPVLDATRQVYEAGKHVEISMLMVTDLSDDEESALKMASWVRDELGPEVPLHFVRFHPDYRMRDTIRTPIPRLLRAQELARREGLEHVYLGNVYHTEAANSTCSRCGSLLVRRYGLSASLIGLGDDGCCTGCGHDANFELNGARKAQKPTLTDLPEGIDVKVQSFDWHGDICSLHVQALNTSDETASLFDRRRYAGDRVGPWRRTCLQPGESYRYILSKSAEDELGPEVALEPSLRSNLHEVFDRAHFPTVALDQQPSESDVSPLPVFPGNQQPIQLAARDS